MSKDPYHRRNARGRPSHKRAAQEANEWADKIRAEAKARERDAQPVPVKVPA